MSIFDNFSGSFGTILIVMIMKLKYLYLILFVLIIIFGIFVFSRSQLCTITYVIDDAIVQTEKINRNSSFPLIDSPSKDGYVFVG